METIKIDPVESISAEELLEETLRIIKETRSCNEDFLDSILIARKNGELIVPNNPENPFRSQILAILRNIVPPFAIQDLTKIPTDPKKFKLPPMRYKPELAEVLANEICKILFG